MTVYIAKNANFTKQSTKHVTAKMVSLIKEQSNVRMLAIKIAPRNSSRLSGNCNTNFRQIIAKYLCWYF